MAEHLWLINSDRGVSAAWANIKTVVGPGALGELAGGDEFSVNMQALAAGTHRGDQLVPLAVVEPLRGFERLVALKLKADLAVFHGDHVIAPPIVVAGVASCFAEAGIARGRLEPEGDRVVAVGKAKLLVDGE